MQSQGINLIPSPPVESGVVDDSRTWNELLVYREKLVQARNGQLEYQHNMSSLHKNIKEACKELTKRDNNVKEDLEILSLERSRLGYLRDELSRRAEMLSVWEKKVKAENSNDAQEMISKPSEGSKRQQKEVDRMNATRLEAEMRRKQGELETSMRSNHTSTESSGVREAPSEEVYLATAVPTPPGERVSYGEQGFTLVERAMSVRSYEKDSSSSGSSPLVSGSVVASSDPPCDPLPDLVPSLPQSTSPIYQAGVPEQPVAFPEAAAAATNQPPALAQPSDQPVLQPPTPYPFNEKEAEKVYTEMSLCLNFLWQEYSTDISQEMGGKSVRLMSLPNLIRLCGDADFGVGVSAIIEIFLHVIKLSEDSIKLVEKRFFMVLLQSVLRASPHCSATDPLELTDKLFDEYLMPLAHRVKLQGRSLCSKHPPLPRSPISGLRRSS